MKRKAKIIFSKSNRKYYYSEITAYLCAIASSSYSAHIAERYTQSDILITLFSCLVGTAGFLIPAIGIYTLLNLGSYHRGEREVQGDVGAISRSYFESLVASYAVRIPLQFFMQKAGLAPAAAAPIAQTIAGQIGNIVRFYGNYKRKLYGHSEKNNMKSSSTIKTKEGAA